MIQTFTIYFLDVKPTKALNSPASSGLFSPLVGGEYSQQLKAKYELDDNYGDDSQLSVKSEKLSALVLNKKQKAADVKSPPGRSKKVVVAVGGESVKKGKFLLSDQVHTPRTVKNWS